MNKKLNKLNNQKGFTLIELLIVIVIIGILSGVLISVIDPVRQQNRSRNASIKAALNKASFAINTSRAGLGRLPYDGELTNELENITINPGTTTACDTTTPPTAELKLLLTVAGTNLPTTCGDNNFMGDSSTTNPCYFFVASPSPQSSKFRVMADAYRLDPGATEDEEASTYYVFDSSEGFFECPTTVTGLETASGTSAFATEDLLTAGCTAIGTE